MRMQYLVDVATSEPPPLRHSVDEIVQQGRRVRRRRRGWAASGTAAVAIAVAAVLAVPSLIHNASSPAPAGADAAAASDALKNFVPSADPFAFTFTGYRVGKLRVAAPVDVSTAYQLASVYADGLVTNDAATDAPASPGVREETLYAYLTVYRPGAYDPSGLANAQPVTVAGRPGLESVRTGGPWTAQRVLAVQYAQDAWLVINANSSVLNYPSAKDLRDLAAGLRPSTPATARIPLTMTYVPAGYHLNEVGTHAMAGLNGIAAARNGDFAGLMFSNPALPATGLTAPFGGVEGADPAGSFQIFVVPSANSNQRPAPGIRCMNGFCNRWVSGGSVNVQVSSGGRLSNGEMTRILNGITVGDVRDDRGWTPVTTAIP